MDAEEVVKRLMIRKRQDSGYSQVELARMIGVSDSAISDWEHFDKPLRLANAERYFRVFDLTVAEFLKEAMDLSMELSRPHSLGESDPDAQGGSFKEDQHLHYLLNQVVRSIEDLMAYLKKQ